MDYTRKTVINGKTITEYMWGKKFVVYIDNKLFDGDFETAIEDCKIDEESEK